MLAFAMIMVVCGCVLPSQAVSPPTISPSTGSFTTAQTVTMSAAAGTIYYSLGDGIPSASSIPYTSAITISGPTQINAVAYQSGTYSAVTTVFLDVDAGLAPILQSGLILRLTGGLGVTTALGSPAPVSKWFDLSGNNNDATGTAGSEPIFKLYGMNNLPTVNFNGSSQYLSLPSGFANFPSGIHAFIVIQPSAVSSGARILDLGHGASGSDNIIFQVAASGSLGEFRCYNSTTPASVQSAGALVQDRYELLEAKQAAGSGTFYLNGSVGTTASITIPNVTRTTNFLGQASSGGNYFAGNIAEVLLYSTALSTSQRGDIESWLMQKYSILAAPPIAPIISVGGGILTGPTQVMIATQDGSTTFFSTDGSTPDSNSPVYNGGPINIAFTQTLKAVSFKNGLQSTVSSETYTLDATQWPAPNSGDTTAPVINLELPVPTL